MTLKKGLDKVLRFKSSLVNLTKQKQGSRKEAVKKIWNHIKTNKLKGGENEKYTHKGKTYKGGQVILCKTKLMKEFSGGKNKIAMTEIAQFISKNIV